MGYLTQGVGIAPVTDTLLTNEGAILGNQKPECLHYGHQLS